MRRTKIIIVAVLAGVLAFGGLIGFAAYETVFAQSPTPTTPSPANPQKMGGRMMGGFSDQELADALGIGVDKLQAAYTSANSEALKEAVSKGLITQKQADQLAQRQKQGQAVRPFGLEGILSKAGIDYNSLLANALNIKVDQLTAGYTKAYNTHLDALVKAGTITQAQADRAKGAYALSNSSSFQSALKSAFATAVNQAVKDGIISQAQADAILNANTNKTTGPGFFGGLWGGFGPHGGFGGFGGRRGGPFGRPGFKNNNNANPKITPTPAAPNSSGL